MKRNQLSLLFCVLSVFSLVASDFTITNFGAKPDGKTLNTVAIQKAIDAAAKVGGTVIVPAGTFVSGTIFLKSNIVFHLSPKARLVGSPYIKDYKTMTWGHHEDRTPWHFIVAKNQENIVINGSGTIDGNDIAYREPNRKNEYSFYHEIEFRPSPLIEIQECKNVIVENISIVNSPGWTLHLFDCDVAKVDKVSITNSLFGPNSDGIDITGSHDVSVSNCYISVGDDCIALKTTEDSRTCERIAVTNCIFETNCVAFRVGFESRKDFRDITLSNCVVKNGSRAIDLRTVEGGNIENVIISGMTGQVNSGWAFDRVIEIQANRINNTYDIAIKEHPNYRKDKPVAKAGFIRNVLIENMMIRTSGRILLGALPETSITNVTFRDITLDYFLLEDPYETGLKAAKSPGFAVGMPFVRSQRAAIVAEGVTGFTISNFKAIWPTYPVSESCFLLTSPNRLFNPSFFKGNEREIKSGEYKVEFKPFAFKNVKGAVIENSTKFSSEGSADFMVKEASEVTMK